MADASTRPTVATAADQRSFFDRRRQCGHHCAKKLLGSDWPDRLRPAQGAAPAVTDLVGIPTRLQSAVASNEPQRISSQLFNTQPKERVADAVASDPRFVAVKCRKRISEHLQTQAAKEARARSAAGGLSARRIREGTRARRAELRSYASAVSSAWIANSFITHTGKPWTPKVERAHPDTTSGKKPP